MSKIEVDKIDPQSGTDLELGTSGDTITIPAGVTFDSSAATTTLPDGSVTNDQLVNDNITINGSSVSLGGSTTIETGTSWQSTIVTGTTLTAEAGKGYWINTTSNICTITLPASASVGDTIEFSDYLRTWGTNAVTLNQNSLNFQGYTSPNPEYNTSGQSVRIVYSGATQGWIPTVDDDVTNEVPQAYSVDFLVIAGGGGGGYYGGGGAGGYRNSFSSESSGGGGSSETALSFISGTVYTVTVGAGGPGSDVNAAKGTIGENSSISGTGITTITSIGGGAGGGGNGPYEDGITGGSGGGGGGGFGLGASGTANQGYAGGNGQTDEVSFTNGGGGGGAGAVGTNGTLSPNTGGNGGNGLSSSITGSAVTRAGGGGAGSDGAGNTGGTGGTGGGGDGADSSGGSGGTVNTGSGGGGNLTGYTVYSGGSGVVILSMLDADYSGTTTGSPTVATGVSGKTVLTFNGDGSYTG